MSGRQSSAVDEALRLIRGGASAYAAAKLAGIAMTTVYRACKRHGIPVGSAGRKPTEQKTVPDLG